MRYYVVDAFTDKVFSGNPAGVIITDEPLKADMRQRIAMENNLSETAFAVRREYGYDLCWHTVECEIDLCGHATLATAYIAAYFDRPNVQTIRFLTRSGELSVSRRGDMFCMDFPSRMPRQIDPTPQLEKALGLCPDEVWASRDLMCVFNNESIIRDFRPNYMALQEVEGYFGVLITAPGGDCDFVSRCFFPNEGINEDPVTGSAHCNFIPYWSGRLGKKKMTARQLSKRGGTLYCRDRGDRVEISGKAVLYSVAEINVD